MSARPDAGHGPIATTGAGRRPLALPFSINSPFYSAKRRRILDMDGQPFKPKRTGGTLRPH
ncbi:MAG: hypothetical protein B7Y95_00150 [Rhizobiales bacterium 32-66-11]|nr:MAG: hypothetical protein B7Y95_00150 [Rhizobiales bacterium 32-66-11]